jgi:hypothetical protein
MSAVTQLRTTSERRTLMMGWSRKARTSDSLHTVLGLEMADDRLDRGPATAESRWCCSRNLTNDAVQRFLPTARAELPLGAAARSCPR